MLPILQAGQVWRHPVLREALQVAGDWQLPADMVALGARLPQVLDMLDDLPQTYAHGDASPQDLLLPAGEPGTIAVIDWGFGTLLPVGFDLGQLLVGLAHAGQTDPAAIPAIDAEIFPAYLAGLAAEDYQVDPAQVRAGYLGSLAARSALCAIPFEALDNAVPGEQTTAMFAGRMKLTRLMLDLAAAALPAGLCAVPEYGCYVVDVVEMPGGDADHQVIGLVIGQGQPAAVEAVERDDGGQREPLVAVDERVVAGDGMQQRGGLGIQVRVGILAERGRLRAGQGRVQQPVVAYRAARPERPLRDMEQFGQRRVDHWPSRSSASAYRGSPSSSTRSSSSARLWFSTYSRIACRATSCMDRCSRSARRRSAAVSSSVSLRVIAMP
jgi:hypothetical protein